MHEDAFGGCRARFWYRPAVVAVHSSPVPPRSNGGKRQTSQVADTDTEERQASFSWREASMFLEHDGEGRKESVQRGIRDGDVNGQEQHDRLGDEEVYDDTSAS